MLQHGGIVLFIIRRDQLLLILLTPLLHEWLNF